MFVFFATFADDVQEVKEHSIHRHYFTSWKIVLRADDPIMVRLALCQHAKLAHHDCLYFHAFLGRDDILCGLRELGGQY